MTAAEAYLAAIAPKAIKVLRSGSLPLSDDNVEALVSAIEEGEIDTRLYAAVGILRAVGQRVPESVAIKKGDEIAKPERDEWLVLTYSGATTAPRPTIRNARTKDYRKGRYATYVPVANR